MMQEENLEYDFQECEAVIRQIKGVTSARIVADFRGEIAEIHILAGPDRSPKQVVRDVESALMARFGINVDHKKISVAQMNEGEEPRSGGEMRPKLSGVSMILTGRTVEAKVQLEIGGEIYEGIACGPNTASNKVRLVSQATVAALEDYLKGTCNIVTEDIKTFNLGGQAAVAACVSLVTNVGEERLIGSVFVRNDDREAAVKATLAAVNRRLNLLFE